MKYIHSFLILLICSCSSSEDKDIKTNFINDFYINKNYEIEKINNYMTNEYNQELKKLTKKEQEINNEYLKEIIKKMRVSFLDINHEYKIKKKEDCDIGFIEKNKIHYNGNGMVYYLLSKDESMISFFIIENKKIHSFCPDIYKSKKNNIKPYFFFK